MKCGNCGEELHEGAFYCGNCGEPVDIHNYCNKCGEKIEAGQKFCRKCGAPVEYASMKPQKIDQQTRSWNKAKVKNANRKASSKEKAPKAGNQTSDNSSLNSYNILIIIIIIGLIAQGMEYIPSDGHLSADGFSADMPSGYSISEGKYMAASGITVPRYMISDNNGQSVINFTYLPSSITGIMNKSDIREVLEEFEFEDIEEVSLGSAQGYKGTDANYVWDGSNFAYVMIEGSDHICIIDYLNEGNLSLLKQAKFSDFTLNPETTVPDEDVIFDRAYFDEIESDAFTIKTPEGWKINQWNQSMRSRYNVDDSMGNTKITIFRFNYGPEDYDLIQSDSDPAYASWLDFYNNYDSKPYEIGGVEGKTVTSDALGYLILAVNDHQSYLIKYSDERSLGVVNTLTFK